jgi:uncharacterized membrane protein YphA (DoxX/SURF4 family)
VSDESHRPAGWAGGRGRGWAGGRLRSPLGRREEQVIRQAATPADPAPGGLDLAAPADLDLAPAERVPADLDLAPARPGTAPARPGTARARPSTAPATRWRGQAERAGDLVAEWAPVAGRVLLGLVLAWFGYHELTSPGQWTGYVPVINEASQLAIVAVLVHGWVLFMLAAALIAGIAPRISAAIASVLLLEIVISLSVSGLSDTSMRDVGVLGLAVVLTGCRNQRLVLRN